MIGDVSALASNLCFSVDDGQFVSRTDLMDAPTCALARGASVLGLAVCNYFKKYTCSVIKN